MAMLTASSTTSTSITSIMALKMVRKIGLPVFLRRAASVSFCLRSIAITSLPQRVPSAQPSYRLSWLQIS